MRVLVLSKYDRLAASTRHRLLQYGPYLAEHGVELTLSPLFDDRYLAERFGTGRASLTAVATAYGRRLVALASARRFDLALVAYELFPYLPAVLERALRALRLPFVTDQDDAIFHMYDRHRSRLVRTVLGGKLRPVLAGARAVMAGSRYLAEYAERFNRNVFVVPTVIDMARYPARPPKTNEPAGPGSPFTVGWIGSPSTSRYLDLVAPALTKLAAEGPVRLIATGSRPLSIPGVDVDVRPWSEATEVSDLHEAEVGIMPLPNEPWARGKCAFKLIQYMGAGLPTVASPVGANAEVVTHDTGRFATSTAEWVGALRHLRDDPGLRDRLAAAGRARAVAQYSLASQQHRVLEILQDAAR